SGRPLSYTLAETSLDPALAWKLLKWTEEAAAKGYRIKGQVLPRPVGFLLGHALSLNPFYSTPTYLELAKLPFGRRVAELRKPEVRAKILSESNDPHPKNSFGYAVRKFDMIFPLGDPPNYEPAAETSVEAQAKARGVSPEELAYDMMLEEGGGAIL